MNRRILDLFSAAALAAIVWWCLTRDRAPDAAPSPAKPSPAPTPPPKPKTPP